MNIRFGSTIYYKSTTGFGPPGGLEGLHPLALANLPIIGDNDTDGFVIRFDNSTQGNKLHTLTERILHSVNVPYVATPQDDTGLDGQAFIDFFANLKTTYDRRFK